MNLEELRRKAMAATPGPWLIERESNEIYGIYEANKEKAIIETDAGYYPPREHDAEFITSFNPQVALALLDRIETYEKALKELTLNHEHQSGLSHTRALGDSYGWCDFCQTKVSWGGDDPASEALKKYAGDV